MTDDNDSILNLAVAYELQPQPRADVLDAFRAIPRAPLCQLIDCFLDEHPKSDIAFALRAIARLNQGYVDDLRAADFKSYLIATTSLTEAQLDKCASVLTRHEFVLSSRSQTQSGELLAAGRGDRIEDTFGLDEPEES